jgi:alkylation response protein AidB-like acyl-CoA dehydrogenase
MEQKARHAALCDRAGTLITFLKKRAERTEELRQLPPETLRDLHEAGLFRLLQPEALGGAELDFRALVDIGAILARACASTAWNLTNLASHHWMLAMFPEEAQDRIWGEDRNALIASSFASNTQGIAWSSSRTKSRQPMTMHRQPGPAPSCLPSVQPDPLHRFCEALH